MKNLFKLIAAGTIIFTSAMAYSISVSAEYSFPYDEETGFAVPYTVVSENELQESEYEVGEIHSEKDESSVLLPNMYTLNVTIPWSTISYNHIGDVRGTETRGVWISTNEAGDKVVQQFDRLAAPVYYKNRLFSKTDGRIQCLNQDTLEVERSFIYDGGYNPFELDTRTVFETDLYYGYEFTPGNFIRSRSIGYYKENVKDHMYISQGSKCFGFSCDGVYYINVQKPEEYAVIRHYIVNGEDCLVFKLSDNQYLCYRFADLQQIWHEYTKTSPYVFVNNVRLAFDRPPVIKNGTTLMPLRFLLETIGADVEWDENTNSAIIKYNDEEIRITAGSNRAYINKEEYTLKMGAEIIDGKMMIPLRFISTEGLGLKVEWDEASRSVFIDVPADNINVYVKLFSEVNFVEEGIYINGEAVKAVNSGGRTFIPIPILAKYFDINNDNIGKFYNEVDIEMSKKAVPDKNIDLSTRYFYMDYDKLWMTYINKQKICLKYEDQRIPLYMFGNEMERALASGHGIRDEKPINPSVNYFASNLICLEETADMMECLHYNWDGEANKLYIYIQDDMVTYDNALKAILDKKNIRYDTDYDGDYYVDIKKAQEHTDNDLSKLVKAGITANIISKIDYPDGHLRPTRNISYSDLYRMLKGLGYKYSYKPDEADLPVSSEEFEKELEKI